MSGIIQVLGALAQNKNRTTYFSIEINYIVDFILFHSGLLQIVAANSTTKNVAVIANISNANPN